MGLRWVGCCESDHLSNQNESGLQAHKLQPHPYSWLEGVLDLGRDCVHLLLRVAQLCNKWGALEVNGCWGRHNFSTSSQYLNIFDTPLTVPVSPSGVSGISACQFRNCRRLDKLWFVQAGQASFQYGRAVGSEVRKLPSALQAYSFFSNLFLKFCTLSPAFSSIILFHMFVHAFDTLKIPVQKVMLLERSWTFRSFFFCHAIFTWIWIYKTHDLTDDKLTVGSFVQAIAFMWSNWQIPGWLQFIQKKLFPFVPSLADFNRASIRNYFTKQFAQRWRK